MATFKFEGIDEYIGKLKQFTVETETIIGEAVYDGADLVADATKSALESIPVDNRRWAKHRKSISKVQKEALIESFGIAKLEDDKSFRNVKLGFDGYNPIKSERWPLGQPNIMIIRALESGTSFMPKNRIVSRTVNKTKKMCEQKMQESIDKNCKKIFG